MLAACLALQCCTYIASIKPLTTPWLFLIYTTSSASVQRITENAVWKSPPTPSPYRWRYGGCRSQKKACTASGGRSRATHVLTLCFSIYYPIWSPQSSWSYNNFSHLSKSLTIELQSWDRSEKFHSLLFMPAKQSEWWIPKMPHLWNQ